MISSNQKTQKTPGKHLERGNSRRTTSDHERRRTDKDRGEHTGLNTQGDYTQVELIRAGQTITKRRENKQRQEVKLDMTQED